MQNLLFGDDSFDIIWMQNALDHTVFPKTVLMNMVSILRKDGFIIIIGFENEGQFANYNGLHVHDLFLLENKLMCKSFNTSTKNVLSLSEGLSLDVVESAKFLDHNNRDIFHICYRKI